MRRERGFVLMVTAFALTVLIGMLGLALDLGHLYVVRNEAQTYADLSALAAARELDGTRFGVDRAREGVTKSPLRWDFGARAFSGTAVEFSTDQRAWTAKPVLSGEVRFVRVTANLDSVELYFLPAVMGQRTARVRTMAVAESPSFGAGLLPLALVARDARDDGFGFRPGERLELRWCLAETTPTAVRDAIESGRVVQSVELGLPLALFALPKPAAGSLRNRANQDTNATASTYDDYRRNPGNGRRVAVVPVVDAASRVAGLARVFLPAGTPDLRAEYLGPAADRGGVRLVQ